MTLSKEMVSAGSGCAIANAMMNGFETTKVKLQLYHQAQKTIGTIIYQNPTTWGVMRQISQEEGIFRGLLTPGLSASLTRSTLYGAYRVGLYPTIRDSMCSFRFTGSTSSSSSSSLSASPTLMQRLASGMATGAIGSALSCPLDVIRTRMQADAGLICEDRRIYTTGLRQGKPVRYNSMFEAFIKILRKEGIQNGLYRGASITVLRATVLNGSQLAAYDTMKHYAPIRTLFAGSKEASAGKEGPMLHVTCAFISGVIAQTFIMPIDTIKSHLMMGKASRRASDSKLFVQLIRNPLHLFRGYIPACTGQGLIMVLQMPLIEEFRRLVGVGAI